MQFFLHIVLLYFTVQFQCHYIKKLFSSSFSKVYIMASEGSAQKSCAADYMVGQKTGATLFYGL